MATSTGLGTAHRHKTAAGNWYDKTDVASGSTHTHDVTPLADRIAKLETSQGAQDVTITSMLQRLQILEATVAGIPGTPPSPPPPPILEDKAPGTLQAIIDAAASGATTDVPPGIYHELATFTKAGTFRFADSVIDGDNTRTEWVRIAASNVTIEDLWCRNAKLGTHQAGSFSTSGSGRNNFHGTRLHLQQGQATILKFQDSSGHRFTDCDLSLCPESLFSFNKANDVEWHGCTFHDALGTLPGFNQADEGGAGKWGGYDPIEANSGSTTMLFDGCEFYNIVGKGPWADIKADDLTLSNCRIHDVQREGVMFEISNTATITNNVVYRCGRTGPSWGYGAGILVASSRGATISGNTVWDCARGIFALSQRRVGGSGYDFNPGVDDVTVSGNTIIATRSDDVYLAGAVADWADPTIWSGVSFSDNDYYHPNSAAPNAFAFHGTAYTPAQLASFMALFGDTTSRMLTSAQRDAALAAAGLA